MKAPCKGCADRAVGCHASCGKYIEYAEERRQARERKAKDLEINEGVCGGLIRRRLMYISQMRRYGRKQ